MQTMKTNLNYLARAVLTVCCAAKKGFKCISLKRHTLQMSASNTSTGSVSGESRKYQPFAPQRLGEFFYFIGVIIKIRFKCVFFRFNFFQNNIESKELHFLCLSFSYTLNFFMSEQSLHKVILFTFLHVSGFPKFLQVHFSRFRETRKEVLST